MLRRQHLNGLTTHGWCYRVRFSTSSMGEVFSLNWGFRMATSFQSVRESSILRSGIEEA